MLAAIGRWCEARERAAILRMLTIVEKWRSAQPSPTRTAVREIVPGQEQNMRDMQNAYTEALRGRASAMQQASRTPEQELQYARLAQQAAPGEQR